METRHLVGNYVKSKKDGRIGRIVNVLFTFDYVLYAIRFKPDRYFLIMEEHEIEDITPLEKAMYL